jgi:branched-chain amino acid aminotransferase
MLMLMPWDDHLVHRGDGVFETIKYVGRKLYQLDPHLRRMKLSCQAIHLEPPCSWAELKQALIDGQRRQRNRRPIRILLGRGPGGFGIDPFESPVQSLYLVAYRMHIKPEAYFEKGVTAFRTSIPAKQAWMATVKTTNYLPNVLMKREGEQRGFPFCYDDGVSWPRRHQNICLVDERGGD